MNGTRLDEPKLEPMIEALRMLVEHESPSGDEGALEALGRVIAARLEAVGGRVERVEEGGHVVARFFEGKAGRPALIVGHFDTVWPVGTLEKMPWRVEHGRAHGPGTFDMKAGLVLAEFAMAGLVKAGLEPARPVVCVFTTDEEVGSPTGRRLVERLAGEAAYALVLEPPLPGGGMKTARKGVGRFRLEVDGVPAHAGLEPEKGRSALIELAHQLIALQSMNDPATGTTLTAGLAGAGTTPNVVPAQAWAELDARAWTSEEARKLEETLAGLTAHTTGTSVRVSGGFNRPPMERTKAIANLAEQAKGIGKALGLELTEGRAGGGSDGNFTAAMGLPTLDGLGVPGDGAHASHEHVEVERMPERARWLASLLMGLETG